MPAAAFSPLLGWRVWRVRQDGLLLSVLHDDVWQPGRPLAALCRHGHAAPRASCECGIYAVREAEEARRYLVGRNDPHVAGRILGRVALWGTVVVAEHGWRASHAYPATLEGAAVSIAGRYGVPVWPGTTTSRSCAPRSPRSTA